MEDPCLVASTSNFFENFLDHKKTACVDLPILDLGTSALEQFLEQTHHLSEQQRMRMSPDSTMESGMNSRNGHSGSPDQSPCADQVPDSTTSDYAVAYDSDAFNSEDSCQSFPDVSHDVATGAEINAPSFTNANLLLVHTTKDEESSSSSNSSNFSFDLNSHHHHLPTIASSAIPSSCIVKSGIIKTTSNHSKNAKKCKKAGDTLLKCEFCIYTTRFKEHLSSHMQSHATTRNYVCHECGHTFKWSHSLKRHQRTHSTTADFRYSCRYCLKTFSRKDHLKIHEDLHATSGSTFPCGECGTTFKNKKTLAGHMKTHTAEKAFKCSQCEAEFTRKASLNRHVNATHKKIGITCYFCPAVFSYRSTLQDHIKAAHNNNRREYGCDLCGVQFAVKAYLSKHMTTCRNRAIGKSFACSLCSKSFPTKRHLHEHNKRKHPSQQHAPSPQQQHHQQQQQQHQQQQQQHQNQYNNNLNYDNYYYQQHSIESPFSVKTESSPKSTTSSSSYDMNPHPAVMGHDLPLPQISNSVMEEDHNVGSLLRLVDQLEGSEYVHGGQSAGQPGSPSLSSSARSAHEPMIHYEDPILDPWSVY